MSEVLIKMVVGILWKFATEAFVSKLLIASVDAWAKSTENKWDDKVSAAMAEALGVEVK